MYSDITRLVHHYDFLPIELLSYVITGSSGADDGMTVSYSDASWTLRNQSYDDMTPEEIRAAARAARNAHQVRAHDDIQCRSFAIVASQGSRAYARISEALQSAAETMRKRKLAVLESEETPEQAHVAAEPVVEDVSGHHESDDDVLAFLGC